ncbi:MAG: BlaI/MecI/CopY family transcriptional regulator [Candidatus Bathyarchaeota archaeon]|uniref:BlaI/MecI/CopY family transcriptional regulator n=1 Tax=Candidatus Bathycorpusculum sp. TaxID=2994959 RepID=UPI00282CCF65|nr:BlaI/MecI/CopY family transcriptional regulator [Candidatus Termiticorpusculum sp.]MCL2257224.1 BlaI/MecI/CopY family transcriptional regulator [Candidatus Termiticorpusculum sp.]MCL2292332.1 BlaI/MecI/CopY family transcriptional regulator [Candidatus Termiticorpusculum sp.]
MPVNKMRVEIYDNEGNRYIVAFDGKITRDKTLRILDIAELLGGTSNENQVVTNSTNVLPNMLSRFEKVQQVIQKSFPLVWFVSKDVQLIYEQELKEPVSLSTVSTYLSRMTNKGMLMRTGSGNNVKYKVAPNLSQAKIKQQIKNNY